MTPNATCEEIRERSLVERYVAGKLSEAETTELEAHYLACARCQADVRLAAAIRSAPVGRVRRPRVVWAGVGLAVAAGATAILLIAPRRPSPELRRLGALREAPVYLGIRVRAAPTRADSIFDVAMTAYSAGQYHSAAARLDAALTAGAESALAEFFRAASLLMSNDAEAAAAGFERVIALGDTPYLPESHYYLAKALLRLGRARDALMQLRQVGGRSRELRGQASALADSVRTVAR